MSWADMSSADQSRSASLLLDAVEKGAFLLANNLYEGRFSDRAPNVGTCTFSFLSIFALFQKLPVEFRLNTVCVCVCVPGHTQIWRCMC